MNVPEQTLVTRRQLFAALRTNAFNPGELAARNAPNPPTAISVSKPPGPIFLVDTTNPDELFTGPPSSDNTCRPYGSGVMLRPGISNAATGPVKSRIGNWGNTTKPILRVMS